MNVESAQVDSLMATALFLGTPFFVFFGWLSDKIGRKAVMMTGMLIAILAYRPIYDSMFKSVNLENKTVAANGISEKRTAKIHNEIATDSLVTFHKETLFTDGTLVKKDSIIHWSANGPIMKDGKAEEPKVTQTIKLADNTKWYLVLMVFIQVIFVTMVYGPIAAFLVEMFPVRIRYTSMSLPYHIGNGVFGGLLPAVATYLVTTGKEAGHATWYLEGLWYPIGVAGVCLLIGLFYLKSKNNNIHD